MAIATGSYSAAELAAAGAHVVLADLTDTARVLAAVTGTVTGSGTATGPRSSGSAGCPG